MGNCLTKSSCTRCNHKIYHQKDFKTSKRTIQHFKPSFENNFANNMPTTKNYASWYGDYSKASVVKPQRPVVNTTNDLYKYNFFRGPLH